MNNLLLCSIRFHCVPVEPAACISCVCDSLNIVYRMWSSLTNAINENDCAINLLILWRLIMFAIGFMKSTPIEWLDISSIIEFHSWIYYLCLCSAHHINFNFHFGRERQFNRKSISTALSQRLFLSINSEQIWCFVDLCVKEWGPQHRWICAQTFNIVWNTITHTPILILFIDIDFVHFNSIDSISALAYLLHSMLEVKWFLRRLW